MPKSVPLHALGDYVFSGCGGCYCFINFASAIMNVILIVLALVPLFIYNIIQHVVLLLTPRRFRKKKDIRGQKILITGAGSGIGRQLCIELSSHSTCLVLLDINKKALLETKALLDPSSTVFIYECDVTNPKMVEEVAEAVTGDIGVIDILVNNAGVVVGQDFLDLSNEDIKKTIDVNTLGNFWVCRAFIPGMIDSNIGHLVFIASILGLAPVPKLTDYSASKFAIIGLAESLEVELRHRKLDGIKFTVVFPGHIDTGLFDGTKDPMAGIFTVEVAAQEIVSGILEEMETIFLPFYYNYLIMLKSLSPRWLTLRFYELVGNLQAMDNFRGRSNNCVMPTSNENTDGN